MTAGTQFFQMPKDQLLEWRFLRLSARSQRYPQASEKTKRFSFFWARNAIYHALEALGVCPGDRVLVPAYICSAAIEPIEARGVEAVFYEVDADCRSDLSALESKLDSRTRAVLAVHYFGFPQAIQEFREFCDRHQLFLIEDCAHVLLGEIDGRPLGSFGDASVFSWRKFFPLYDGGELILSRWVKELRVPWPKERLLFTLKVGKNLLEQLLPAARFPASDTDSSAELMLKEAQNSSSIAFRSKDHFLSVNSNDAAFDPLMVNFPMTRISRMLLARHDVAAIGERRRAHYLFLQKHFSAQAGLRPLFPQLPAHVVPWIFPLFFEGIPNAHRMLRQMGVPAVTWGGVRHPRILKAHFPAADFLYENLVFLPLHQALEEKDLDLIVRAARAVCLQARGA